MNSIRTTLVVMLIAAFTLVSFLAALNGYLSSMKELEKLLDQQLLHASELLRVSGGDIEPTAQAADASGGFVYQAWQDGRLTIRSPGAPVSPIGDLVSGYHYANFEGNRWRTLTREFDEGAWYILAERADLRHQLAENAVLESVLPLLLWLPVSALLVWVLVGWGLRPLRELSNEINGKRSDDLKAIDYPNPPEELQQLITSTNSLLGRLSDAFEREKHFASHAAHELRTPLSVLKIHLHNLASELPQEHSGLAHANAGLERMHHLVEQILDLNRTNPAIIKGSFKPVDLHRLVQRVTADFWPEFSRRDQSLSLKGKSVIINGDEVMLETLLANILTNASKYTPEGGEVQVFAGRNGSSARLRIEDSGPGIPEEERANVFQRFYRVTEKYGSGPSGSGLGLAIVQHIVQLHNAKITLSEGHFDQGLAVTVDFVCLESQ
jgi:two-component system sensor histidine kinase QseC